MRATTRRKVSYVVKNENDDLAHRLGVNSLALDPSAGRYPNSHEGGILYTAGRDGVVAGWDLHMPFQRAAKFEIDEEDSETPRREWLLDQSAIPTPPPKSTPRVFSQTHTDWVNDIILCNNKEVVVSASSDRTIKLWKPHSTTFNSIHTLGNHADFVKCLAATDATNWVASAGFDRKVSLWDLNESRSSAILTFSTASQQHGMSNVSGHVSDSSPKASIYALATNLHGNIIATGSPEKVVRLWDSRSGKRITKFTGHTDNIRALLISDDGQLVLSGSSDSTIKLWSTKTSRCLATYETHTDSVWTLYSDHPQLKTFFAGSKDGLVTRTELGSHEAGGSSGEDECVGIFKENGGVAKIVVLDDRYIWTATSSSSVNRWLSIPPKHSRGLLSRSAYNPEIPNSAILQLPPPDIAFSGPLPESFMSSENMTLYAGSVLSIPMSYQEDDAESSETLTPLRDTPESVIEGKPGLSSHLMLNNRRYVLTVDTEGQVAQWDLVECKKIKIFGKRPIEEIAQQINSMETFSNWCAVDTKIGAITVHLDEQTCFDCEMYADEANLPEDYEIREEQRINLGKWVLRYLFEGFVTAELVVQEEELQNFKELQTDESPIGRSSPKFNQQLPEPQTPNIKVTSIPAPAPIASNSNGLSNVTNQATENLDLSQNTTTHSGAATAPLTAFQRQDYFSGAHHDSPPHTPLIQAPPPAAFTSNNGPMSPTSGGFMGRLRNLSVKAKLGRTPSAEAKMEGGMMSSLASSADNSSSLQSSNPLHARAASTPEQGAYNPDMASKQTKGVATDGHQQSDLKLEPPVPEAASFYTPATVNEVPTIEIPPTTTVIISEESFEASTSMDLYRGTVGSTVNDAKVIEKVAPNWLLDYLLYNKAPHKEPVKLTFVLRPHESSNLPELPGGAHNRLLANRVLRVRKLAQYIVDRLKSEDEATYGHLQADGIELLCGETALGPTMTLATIKQRILKASGDVPLSYRLNENFKNSS
ncbi:WD40-repeat-containing domain protein [Umbelopsis sp. AD052]|nr:WD40-repeat-containing domain protein [Umbelopsis sp. AD052]